MIYLLKLLDLHDGFSIVLGAYDSLALAETAKDLCLNQITNDSLLLKYVTVQVEKVKVNPSLRELESFGFMYSPVDAYKTNE